MSDPRVGRVATFLAELKRRKVYQVTAIYLVLAVGALELASLLLPSTSLPPWIDELIIGLAIAGLPLVLVLAWAFDLTESGIERTPERPAAGQAARAQQEDLATAARDGTKPRHATAAPDVNDRPSDLEALDPLVVAVLPFENLSGAESAEPFALGLHDDLLTELSRASALTVISRTSVKSYRGSDKPVRRIARELGAGTIVEGGVQQAGNRIRLNVQLIDARRDDHRWAERYDRELTADNIFELQSELAARIMSELHARLTAEEEAQVHARPTGDLEAYQLLATGRQALVDRSETGFRAAAALFERAIGRDPEYALAWSGLGDALIGLVDYGHLAEGAEETLKRGEEACLRALELDATLAEAHSAWGRLRTAVRDAPGAAAAHARAIELRPSYAGAHQWSCWAYLLLNDGARALDFGHRATRLDPLDPEAAGNLALAHLMVGNPEAALEEARRILGRHPTFEYALWAEALSLQALGRWNEAVAPLDKLRDRWTRGWAVVGRLLASSDAGQDAAVHEALSQLESRGIPFKAGLLHALLGEMDEAIESMYDAQPLPWDEALYLYVHRARPFDRLGDHARFSELHAEVVRSWRAEDEG